LADGQRLSTQDVILSAPAGAGSANTNNTALIPRIKDLGSWAIRMS
jgi:hypothetical protein